MVEITVDAGSAGSTLAAVVRTGQAGLAWSAARRMCSQGQVRVNGVVATDSARRLRAGDVVAVDPHARARREPAFDPAAVVHLDRDVVVVDKPAGLLTVPFAPDDQHTLIDRVQAWLRSEERRPDSTLAAVQRLDKDTTGVLVFARTLTARRALQVQLRAHSVERRYLALVHGALRHARTIETHLIEDRGDGLKGSYGHFRRPRAPLPKAAQRALTHVRPLEQLGARATLVECSLETGRQHQIRIHLSELGHPLLGEQVYIRDYSAARLPAPRPMLHAAVLGFSHPRSEQRLRFERAAPSDFRAALAALRTR
jgi:23S rRNA pseudouridine1911/1915/1917 synthase